MSLEFSPVIVQLSAVPALDDVGVLYARVAISWSHVFCQKIIIQIVTVDRTMDYYNNKMAALFFPDLPSMVREL